MITNECDKCGEYFETENDSPFCAQCKEDIEEEMDRKREEKRREEVFQHLYQVIGVIIGMQERGMQIPKFDTTLTAWFIMGAAGLHDKIEEVAKKFLDENRPKLQAAMKSEEKSS